MITAGELFDALDEWAPFCTAEDFDNSGLLIGGREQLVSLCLVALDFTRAVCDEAVQRGAQVVITHHPVIFDPMKQVDSDSVVYAAIQAGITVISAHTNLDKAPGGVSDTLAERLNLTRVEDVPGGDGCVKMGELSELMHGAELAAAVKKQLAIPSLRLFDAGYFIRKIALCSGSGGSFLKEVLAAGAEAYITGDIKHDVVVAAANAGLTLLDAGHYETEALILEPLREYLTERFPEGEFAVAETDRPLFARV